MNTFVKSLIISMLFSSFIYLEYFDISNKLMVTIFALYAFYLILISDKKILFFSGFFISIFWFWWIGYSFVYYEVEFLIPFVILGIGLIYGGLFFLIGLTNNLYIRVLYLFALSFIYPFGFSYLQLELLFINSYLGVSKIDFALILLGLLLLIKLQNFKKYISLIPLLFTINLQPNIINMPNLKIKLIKTNIPQNIKWDKKYTKQIINNNLKMITKATKEKYDLIIFPETSFPLVLNKNENLLSILKKQSKHISIILGSLHKKNENYHNSTYFFNNTKLQIAHKVVLIPFGEAVPLPQVLRDLINDNFYNGAKDYKPSLIATDFCINGVKFRNTICYEATTNKIYENLKGRYIITISNNAWFVPSIQPTIQNLLLKYYAKKHNVKIFSSTNMGINKIIN